MKAKAKSEITSFVYFAVGVAALGGLLFGYDTGVISAETKGKTLNKLKRTGGSEKVQDHYENKEGEFPEAPAIHLPPIG